MVSRLGNLNDGEGLYYAYDVILTPTSTSTVPEPSAGWLLSAAVLAAAGPRGIKLRKGRIS